jgi:hypothetical protein
VIAVAHLSTVQTFNSSNTLNPLTVLNKQIVRGSGRGFEVFHTLQRNFRGPGAKFFAPVAMNSVSPRRTETFVMPGWVLGLERKCESFEATKFLHFWHGIRGLRFEFAFLGAKTKIS